MASFTMYLWEVLDMEQDGGDGFAIGLDDYPIFDPTYRSALNQKIIRHFWNREIGMETISMFTFAVKRRMHEAMPPLNQLYKSALLEFDPISNYQLTTTRADDTTETMQRDSQNSGTNKTISGSRSVSQNTPSTILSGDADYADSASDANSTTEADSTGTGTDTTNSEAKLNGTSTTTGYQGSPADLLAKYRNTIINPDILVIAALEDCFMGIWDSGVEMLPTVSRWRGILL